MRPFRAALAALAILTTTGAAMAEVQTTHKGYEMPPYVVERAEGGVELRRYGPHIVAEVQVTGDRSTAIGRGFRALAGYIFGGNAEGEKIAMTVPVAQTPADGAGDVWTVQFTMPSSFTLDTLPAPRNAAVKLRAVAGDRQAVVTFSGIPRSDDMAERAETLRHWIATQGLSVTAGPHYQFYDAPMTLPWNRRNEVSFSVE